MCFRIERQISIASIGGILQLILPIRYEKVLVCAKIGLKKKTSAARQTALLLKFG